MPTRPRRITALDPHAPIVRFTGSFRFLSNFYPVPIDWRVDFGDDGVFSGIAARTVEHVYQACKACRHQDVERILAAPTPARARAIGKRIDLIRPYWNELRVPIMRDLVKQKFDQHDALATLLLATGERELVEGNDWGDRFWGATALPPGETPGHYGRPDLAGVIKTASTWWIGENWLGRILMERRSAIRAGIGTERRGRMR